ncbi:MAG: serine/threonine-protein kinase [Rubricoccaceae bacterium]
MDSDFDRVQTLFLEALEQPHDKRAGFLESACDNADERQAVQQLLDADALDSPFLLDEPLVRLSSDDSGAEADIEGRRVGPYQLKRLLGRGGMGAVYLAEREDVGRDVALKIVRGDLADPSARRRFLFERRVLGRLEHPSIARLYDVGVAEDGTPYFAMEHVEGVPVTDYCDHRQLGLEARLRMFEAIGRAVQHAHQHFIVHRDLKPSNIYVTPKGDIKLLDFGIAKALDEAESAQEDNTHTATGRRLLTPAYAAPEQHTDAPVTAASDVYSLGVVLFELLTGSRPETATTMGTLPKRPSTVVTESDVTSSTAAATRQTTVDRLARRLRGDLDVICLKALQPEPERRYASAEAFVDDIKRHLEGLPVTARPDSARYRLKKFVRRHQQGFWASVVGALVLAGVVGFYTVQLQAERDRALTEATKAERVSGFLTDLFGAADPYEEVQGDTLRARDLLARGAARVEAELADEPEVQATVLDAIGDVYVRLGLFEDAEPVLSRALAIRREVLAPDALELAESYRNLAWVHMERGEFAAADSLGELALAIVGPVARTLETARAYYVLGTSRYRQANYPAADSLHQLAGALFESLAGPNDDETVGNLAQLSHVADAMGDDSTATVHAAAVLTARRRAYGENHPHVAEALNDVAFRLRRQGRYNEAEPLYRESIALKRRLLGDDHPAVATSLNNLGVMFGIAGRYDEVGPLLEEALAIRRARYGDVHPLVGGTLGSLSMLAITQEDYELAVARQDEALEIYQQLYDGDHPSITSVLLNQGQVRYQQGQFREAERIYREVLDMERRLRGGDHEQVAKALNNVGAALVGQARYGEAQPFLEDALAMYRRVVGPEHMFVGIPMRHLGRIETARGRYAEAETWLTDALQIQTDHVGPEHPEVGRTRVELVALYEAWGRPQDAERVRSST